MLRPHKVKLLRTVCVYGVKLLYHMNIGEGTIFLNVVHITDTYGDQVFYCSRLWLLIMRFRVRFPFLPWEFFLAEKDSRSDHGLGS